MAEPTPNFVKKNPWLFAVSGLVVIVFAIYVVKQTTAYNALLVNHNINLSEVATLDSKVGTFTIRGGQLNYVYAQAVDFRNDKEMDAGSKYDSYIPYIDPQSKRVELLVKMDGYSPSQLLIHRDDPPQPIQGAFVEQSTVAPEIYTSFENRNYPVGQDVPVFEMFKSAEPSTLKHKIILGSILAVLIGGGPWLLMYLLNRPKKRRKSFSDRYPQRRVY